MHPKILIIDDFVSQRSVVKLHLKDLNVEFLEAGNGLEALSILEKNPDISLIFTDLEMPEMNGIEFTESLRSTQTIARIPVVMISSLQSAQPKALRAGISKWVNKPFNTHELIAITKGILGNSLTSTSFTALLIDDFAPQLSLWKSTLRMDNFLFLEATDAQTALNIVRSNKVDVIITDYLMPKVDGLRFAKKVKSLSEYSHIPIFMLTAATNRTELESEGVVEEVFPKSINPLLVKSKLRQAVGFE